jgi:hypothetical protein
MQSEFIIATAVVVLLVVVLAVALTVHQRSVSSNRRSAGPRTQGPASLHYICAGCSGQFSHSRRTLGAWEKGTRRFFCSDCHTKWRAKQPPREAAAEIGRSAEYQAVSSRTRESSTTSSLGRATAPSLAPARSGCLSVIVLLLAIPTVVIVVAAYA